MPAPRPHRRLRRPLAASISRVPLLLAAVYAGWAGCGAGCGASEGPHLRVLLPEGDPGLDRADNASLVLEPGGPTISVEIAGSDFLLAIELEADDLQREATLYLARGQELLAWGRSAPFVLAGGDPELALFVGRPGALSTFPGAVAGAEGMLAARAPGRGMLLLGGDGGTFLLSERTLQIRAGADLPATPPTPATGALVGERGGGVLALDWGAATLRGWRFDPGIDTWEAIIFDDPAIGPRPDAPWLVDRSTEHLLILGGGEARDPLEITLQPTEGGSHPVRPLALDLGGPRPGASAAWVVRGDSGGVLVFGGDPGGDLGEETEDDPGEPGDDPSPPPLVFFSGSGVAGPPLRWRDAACHQVERSDIDPTAPLRLICLGGLRDGQPTADAALITLPSAGPPEVEILVEWLPEPFPEPQLFADDFALYAQSGRTWLRIARTTPGALAPEVASGPATRITGGHSVRLGTGGTFLVGGVTAEGQPVDRWQVFTPALD